MPGRYNSADLIHGIDDELFRSDGTTQIGIIQNVNISSPQEQSVAKQGNGYVHSYVNHSELTVLTGTVFVRASDVPPGEEYPVDCNEVVSYKSVLYVVKDRTNSKTVDGFTSFDLVANLQVLPVAAP